MSRCGSCFQNWNTQEVLPRVLLCGHTFCEQCIKYGYNDVREAPINRTLLDLITELHQIPQVQNVQISQKDNRNAGIGDQIELELRNLEHSSQGMQGDKTKLINQLGGSGGETAFVKAEDICMVENCSNQRVYKYGKKQVFCQECLFKSSANIFGSASDSAQISGTPSTNVFSTPYKDKFSYTHNQGPSSSGGIRGQGGVPLSVGIPRERPVSPHQLQFPVGRSMLSSESASQSRQILQSPGRVGIQKALFHTPQSSESQQRNFPIFQVNQFDTQSESSNRNSLRSHLLF